MDRRASTGQRIDGSPSAGDEPPAIREWLAVFAARCDADLPAFVAGAISVPAWLRQHADTAPDSCRRRRISATRGPIRRATPAQISTTTKLFRRWDGMQN